MGSTSRGYRSLPNIILPAIAVDMVRGHTELVNGSGQKVLYLLGKRNLHLRHVYLEELVEGWSEVECRLTHAQSDSRTSAYEDYRATRSHDLGEILEVFQPLARQVGFCLLYTSDADDE